MHKHIIAAFAVVAALAVPAAVAAHASVPVGSMWNVGSGAGPSCVTVATPPPAPAGEAAILVGAPGGRDRWCWDGFARLGPDGAVTLPGGIPGEWMAPSAYARETGQAVTVVYQPGGGAVVYLPA